MRDQKELPDEPFDPDSEPPVENDELDFSDEQEPSFSTLSPEFDASELEVVINDDSAAQSPKDDVEPEDLIKEDGARSSREDSADIPADEDLRIVEADEIGAGFGLDEAQLAKINPLDGKPEN